MKHYKVVVFGSRNFDDYEYLKEVLVQQFKYKHLEPSDVTIVEGGARGTDALAEFFAKEHGGVAHKQFPADWDKHGKSAGHIRNAEMAKYADWGIGFWDGKSKGTEGMIKQMKRLDKEVIIISV